jgi:hypothetical protein
MRAARACGSAEAALNLAVNGRVSVADQQLPLRA